MDANTKQSAVENYSTNDDNCNDSSIVEVV